ncbi:hypothetical protein DF047_31260 [Burkholderia cenocepacia]|nr:hypothetical protein DF047_31260 [Burkholderia cenocepacia]
MPSVRQYFFRSINNALLIFGTIAALIIVCLIINSFLPVNIRNGIIIASFHFSKEIGLGVIFLIALFFGHKAYRIYNTEKSFPHELLKMIPATVVWLGLTFCIVVFFMGSSSYNCTKHNYNQQLNGGIKEFQGKRYAINICGSGINNSHFFGDSMESVQLTVQNEQGQIQVKRNYKVFWDGKPGHEPIEITPNSITYQDDENQADHTFTMPPTIIEKFRARLPFFN